jgi:hypothetical protein
MRKILLVASASNFAMGGIAATFVCKAMPNWVLLMNVVNVVIVAGSFAWYTTVNSRRKDQLTLPAIPKQREPRKSNSEE